MTSKTPDQNAPALRQDQPAELNDSQLDQADGGIIAILIGLAKDPKKPGINVALGDGSVRTP